MVYAIAIWGRGRASYGEMPFEKVRLKRGGMQRWVWMSGELGGFFEYTFDGGGLGVECWKGHSL